MAVAFGPARRIVESPNYKWWAYSAIAIGMFLTVMDQSGVNIALPRIAEHFDADIPTVQSPTAGIRKRRRRIQISCQELH